MKQFLKKPREKQGTGSPYQLTVKDKVDEAWSSLFTKTKVPDAQEVMQIEWAEKLVGIAVVRTNNFFKGPWLNYKKLVETKPAKLFNDFSPIQ